MGFSTHGSEQLKRDRLNSKSLKRRGSYFKRKVELTEAAKKEGIIIQETWPHQMKAVKEKLRKEKIVEKKRFTIVIITSVVIGPLLLYAIGRIIQLVFF